MKKNQDEKIPNRRGRPSVGPLITIRLPPDMLAALAQVSQDSGEDRSAVIRAAIERELRRRGRSLLPYWVDSA